MTHLDATEQVPKVPKWGQQRRLEFIEFRLLWEGRCKRQDLSDQFDISEQQATLDFGRYRALAGDGVLYDSSQKRYVRGPAFEPQLIAQQLDRHLLQLMAIETDRMSRTDAFFNAPPPTSIAALPRKPIDWRVVMGVVDAIRQRREIVISYKSLTQDSGEQKTLSPHALGYGTGRWHMRAFAREHADFRDYTLDRIEDVRDAGPSAVSGEIDHAWHDTFTLRIAPNPSLDSNRRKAIEAEHGMEGGVLEHGLPISMCFYLVNDLMLDLVDKVRFADDGSEGSVRPARLQLSLLNFAEYREAEAEARRRTKADLHHLGACSIACSEPPATRQRPVD